MPKLTKSLPKYRLHKASGQAVVNIDSVDHYLGLHGTKISKHQYDLLIAEWLANGRTIPRQPSAADSFTIVELSDKYWQRCKQYYIKNGQPTGEQAGVKAALKYLNEIYAMTLVRDFGPLGLETVRDAMIRAGNSRSYINQNIGRIKRMFRWGVSKQLVDVTVYQALKTLEGLKKGRTNAKETLPILPVPDEVINQTLKFIKSDTTADMIRIQRLTSCRPGELFCMRPKDINQVEYADSGVWIYRPESHKMEHRNRCRIIVVGPKAQQILMKYLDRTPETPCFLRKNGEPYKRFHYSKHIKSACGRAFPAPKDLDTEAKKAWRKEHQWAPNRIRHTASTEIRKLHDLEAAQVIAGHAQMETTQIYAEKNLDKAVSVMAEYG